MTAPPEGNARNARRIWRRGLRVSLFVAIGYLVPVLTGCMNLSTPVDYVMNLGTFAYDPDLAMPADGVRRIVVLKHGIWRSAGSMWKLERALRRHGYEPLNLSYPSTRGTIEEHAMRLRSELEAVLASDSDAKQVEIYFVGHSMGGLQIRHYLSQDEARQPTACVFIATPHRGAVLADKRKDGWLFQTFLGDGAALELSPGHRFYAGLRRLACDCGVIFGGAGDGVGFNDDIPGDDDGTVGVDEAQLPEARDRIRLELGHTRLSFAGTMVRQVLHFLKHRRFSQS